MPIFFLELHEETHPLSPGDSVVYKLGDIPIIYRIVNVHETKGDNNNVNDRALYPYDREIRPRDVFQKFRGQQQRRPHRGDRRLRR